MSRDESRQAVGRRSPSARPPPARAWAATAFVALTFAFGAAWSRGLGEAVVVAMRDGTLTDLVSETARGRQAAVSSGWLLPLPTLLAMPFLPFVPAGAGGLAYLYGLAAAAAAGVMPLARALARAGVRRAAPAAFALSVGVALAAVRTVWADAIPLPGLLAAAWLLARAERPGSRALAGTFLGMAALCHPLGAAAALPWLAVDGARAAAAVWRSRSPDRAAVAGVRAVQVVYALCVYAFLNAMIMGRPLYPLRHVRGAPVGDAAGAVDDFARLVASRYAGCAPVVSGPWGYAVRAALQRVGGYHVCDVHPDKLPAWEPRDFVLVVPSAANPLRAWDDAGAGRAGGVLFPGASLLLDQSPLWRVYLVRRT